MREIEWSVLRQDDEWSLAFNYILLYPALLQKALNFSHDPLSISSVFPNKVSNCSAMSMMVFQFQCLCRVSWDFFYL